MADLDRDGDDDVLTGSWPGRVYWFERRVDGTFGGIRSLRHEDGSEIDVGNSSAPFATHWDGDDRLDLLVGNISGKIVLLPGVADERGEPCFGEARELADVKREAGPTVADWDFDGRPDLLAGDGAGRVVWFRNVGTATAPELSAEQVLIPAPERHVAGDRPARGTRAKICVTDWNEDGLPDLLVGEFGFGAPGPLDETAKTRLAELRVEAAALHKQIEEIDGAVPGQSAANRERFISRREALCAKWVQIDQELSLLAGNYSGRVWLFLRREP